MRRLAPYIICACVCGTVLDSGSKINASKLGRCTSLGCGRALAQDPLLQKFAALVFIISNRFKLYPVVYKIILIIKLMC